MLPKKRRIQKKLFVDALSGKKFNSENFIVYIRKIDNKNPSLFSFSVSKKISKSAVVRNRLRRQGYGVISKHINEISNGFMLFFSFKKTSKQIKFNDLERDIISILKNINAI